jgi:hypothetical protein
VFDLEHQPQKAERQKEWGDERIGDEVDQRVGPTRIDDFAHGLICDGLSNERRRPGGEKGERQHTRSAQYGSL